MRIKKPDRQTAESRDIFGRWERLAVSVMESYRDSVGAHKMAVAANKSALSNQPCQAAKNPNGIFDDKLLICTKPGKCTWGCTLELCRDYPFVLGDKRRAQLGNYMLQ